MNIILFGFKGCGKSYFGKKLAETLHMGFVDTDTLVENLYEVAMKKRLSVREIFASLGEAPFRALEREVILSLQNVQHTVIAVGGGTILDRANVEMLTSLGVMIYLEASKELIKKRIFQGDLPAYLDPMDPENSFERVYESRKGHFLEIKAHKVIVDGKKDSVILDELTQALQKNEQK